MAPCDINLPAPKEAPTKAFLAAQCQVRLAAYRKAFARRPALAEWISAAKSMVKLLKPPVPPPGFRVWDASRPACAGLLANFVR